MSRTTAPLLSFDARGQIAKTQVYASWKGRPYARRYVIPANPNSAEQQVTRNTFTWLNNVWRMMPGAMRDGWDAYADVNRFTATNGWIKQNLSGLRGDADLASIILSPAARSGIPAAAVNLTPGDDLITVALTAPSLPTGWSIVAAHAAAIRQQDPASGILYTTTYGTDASAPYSIPLSALASAQVYVVGGWFSFLKENGDTAYGQSSYGTATTT